MKSVKTFITKAACMLLLVTLSNSFTFNKAQAQLTHTAANESTGNIRFVALDGDMLVFEMALHNLPPKGSMVRIMDEDNNVLYAGRINSETYNVRYKIARGNMLKINFEISDRKILLQQTFNVNFKIEERLEVTKA